MAEMTAPAWHDKPTETGMPLDYWRTLTYSEWLAQTWVRFVVWTVDMHHTFNPDPQQEQA